MGRTKLSSQRLVETRKTNIGHIIIFCEGKTEKYYFDYFAGIMKKNKYTDIRVEIESANGNAQTVLKFADEYLMDEVNNRKFGLYDKYLAFDCDDPPDIQVVIRDSQEKAEPYKLLISNYLFETWLLMHFEDVESKITKRETYKRLSSHLHRQYSKAHKGKIREIMDTGNIEKAIDHARAWERCYVTQGKSVFSNVKEMNPFTNVYELVEQFMVEIS